MDLLEQLQFTSHRLGKKFNKLEKQVIF